jgi:hypothetical protein
MRELRVETSKKAFSLSLGENTDKADLAHDAHARMTPESTPTPTTDHGGPAVMHF